MIYFCVARELIWANVIESETGVPAAKMREFIVQACYAIYDRDDNAALESVVAGLRGSFSAIDKIAQCFVDGEYDFDGTPEQKVIWKLLLVC